MIHHILINTAKSFISYLKDKNDFKEKYGGKVFIVFSSRSGSKKVVRNKEVIEEIKDEIERIKKENYQQ